MFRLLCGSYHGKSEAIQGGGGSDPWAWTEKVVPRIQARLAAAAQQEQVTPAQQPEVAKLHNDFNDLSEALSKSSQESNVLATTTNILAKVKNGETLAPHELRNLTLQVNVLRTQLRDACAGVTKSVISTNLPFNKLVEKKQELERQLKTEISAADRNIVQTKLELINDRLTFKMLNHDDDKPARYMDKAELAVVSAMQNAASRDRTVALQAAKSANTPPEVLDFLAQNYQTDAEIRIAVTQNRERRAEDQGVLQLPSPVRTGSSEQRPPLVRQNAARDVTREEPVTIPTSMPFRELVAEKQSLEAQLQPDGDPAQNRSVRKRLDAINDRITTKMLNHEDQLGGLLKDEKPEQYMSEAPEAVISAMRDSMARNAGVAFRAASSPNTPAEALVWLLNNQATYDAEIRGALNQRFAPPTSMPFRELVEKREELERSILIEPEGAPKRILVKQLEAINDRITSKMLAHVSDGKSAEYSREQGPAVAAAMVDSMKRADFNLARDVANSTNTPSEVLRYLSTDYPNPGINRIASDHLARLL